MADELPPTEPTEQAEAERTRRRWLTLAELLGVAAVLISGLTLWNSYQQRTGEEAEKAAEKQASSAAARTLLLRATPSRDGARLALAPANSEQTIQEQRILFPSALGVVAIETVSEPRIEASWFEERLLRARDEQRRRRGDERLPVAIETSFFSGGAVRRDVAIYDIGYRVEGGGLLGDRDVRLRGLSRVENIAPARAQSRLDALWRARAAAQAQ